MTLTLAIIAVILPRNAASEGDEVGGVVWDRLGQSQQMLLAMYSPTTPAMSRGSS